MAKAHDVHGLHGLMEVVFVLLAWDWDVTIGQEAVVVESFQKQVRCGHKTGKQNKFDPQNDSHGLHTKLGHDRATDNIRNNKA